MENLLRYNARACAFARMALALAAATACGSQDHSAALDASAGNPSPQTESGAPVTLDAGETSDGDETAETGSDAGVVADGGGGASAPPDATSLDSDASPGDAAVGPQSAGTFHGVNWADARDNFVNGLLQVSGLDASSDTVSTVQAKASQILSQFRTKLGANTIRIPINEPTVSSSSWWSAYKGVIDTATAGGMKVMIAYWAYQNGKPDSEAAFKSMWQTVVSDYQSNDLVYFDIHNEPYGFGSSWNAEAAMWMGYFPAIPRGRIIVAGTGYDDNVAAVGGDSHFAETLLELHIYGFQHTSWTTAKQWTDAVNSAVGSYAPRTIVGEWGDTMNTGVNYDVDASDGNNQLSYVVTLADVIRRSGMGSCYWPGLRNGDGYSMTALNTSGTTLTLSVVNASGRDRLRWAWNL